MRFWFRKIYRRAVREIASHFYVNPDSNFHNSILVAGTARSGTTWLGDLIASQIPCRVLFEPFNPDLVPEYRGFHYFQYMRPERVNLKFHAFAQKVFTGEIRNHWIDHQNERVFSRHRLVKEIRINLALKWVHNNFPDMPIVFLIRHPCAVVASRMELGWATDSDIQPFLAQPDLVGDYLAPYLDLIKNARTAEEKHAIVWSISNLVPLKQFNPGEYKVVYYENLCTQPESEVPIIFSFIRQRFSMSIFDKLNQPSQTTRSTSIIVTGEDKISGWRNKLSSLQIGNILRIVERFGMGNLYGDSLLPLQKDGN